MNAKSMSRLFATFGGLALAGGLAGAAAAAQTPQDRQVWVHAAPGQEVLAETVEVHVVDDDVKVIVNGKPVSEKRIRVEDNRVIVLDEHGNEVKSIDLHVGSPGEPHELMFLPEGGDHTLQWVGPGGHEPPKVMIGVTLDEPGPALQRHLRLEPGTSTMITGVYKGLPAHRAGVDQYDVIVRIEGEPSADPQSLRAVLRRMEGAEPLKLELIHEGRKKQIAIDVEPYDAGKMSEAEVIGDGPNVMRFERLDLSELPRVEIEAFTDPERNRRLWFAPGENQFFELRRPEGLPSSPGHPGADVDRQARIEAQLGKLERQLAELSAALERLLEQRR